MDDKRSCLDVDGCIREGWLWKHSQHVMHGCMRWQHRRHRQVDTAMCSCGLIPLGGDGCECMQMATTGRICMPCIAQRRTVEPRQPSHACCVAKLLVGCHAWWRTKHRVVGHHTRWVSHSRLVEYRVGPSSVMVHCQGSTVRFIYGHVHRFTRTTGIAVSLPAGPHLAWRAT